MRVVLLGGGGHAVSIMRLIDRVNRSGSRVQVVGVLDDGRPDERELSWWGLPHLGPFAVLADLDVDGFIPAVGAATARRALVARTPPGLVSPALVDPEATLALDAQIGMGSVVTHAVDIGTATVVGAYTYLARRSAIGHGCVIGDCASVLAGVCLGDGATVGVAATVGTNAVTREGVRIGEGATVGAGAVVLDDVAPGATVVGVPARPVNR